MNLSEINMKPKVIAFYLPQYHPTKNNNIWWGNGFTEWTNVGKAKPLFKGHYQPRVPADLGYYDLRYPEIKEQQALLAKHAGIYGFCYYHYWFGNGRVELELPFEQMLKSKSPKFPFCLCWANESWHSKFWSSKGVISKKILVEQKYPGRDDIIAHFNYLLPAFKDDRYIKINNRILFTIYKPFEHPNIEEFMSIWNDLAKKNNLGGFYFVAQILTDINNKTVERLINLGFDKVNVVNLWDARKSRRPLIQKIINKVLHVPNVHLYKDIYPYFVNDVCYNSCVCPTLIPNWDHSPRSGSSAYLLHNSTPELFRKHVKDVFRCVKSKKNDDNLIFLKSWNEWGEGNYMEPDLKYGMSYIDTLKEELDMY